MVLLESALTPLAVLSTAHGVAKERTDPDGGVADARGVVNERIIRRWRC